MRDYSYLRDHQQKADDMVRESISRGNKRMVLAAPCSFGKTVVMSYWASQAAKKGTKLYIFVDRVNLQNQTIKELDAWGVEYGVLNDVENYNIWAPVQVAMIQTVASIYRKSGNLPTFDAAIIDECHTNWDIVYKMMEEHNKKIFIGLSATPYSKGMGMRYQDLLVPITTRELLDKGMLTPIRYYQGKTIDFSKCKTEKDIERMTSDNKEILTGDVIKNWFEHANGLQSIAFTPSIDHSKHMVERYNSAGITAEHIDGYMKPEQRQELIDAHNNNEFKFLSCSKLLNTGYDSPSVACLADFSPSGSITTYVQRLGRCQRLFKGKEYSVYLDHCGNSGDDKHGPIEDIYPVELHDGKMPHNERNLTNKKEKKEAKERECPSCYETMRGRKCQCGYEIPIELQMMDDGQMLEEVKEGKTANRKTSKEVKERFLSDLIFFGKQKKWENPTGWAKNKYREKFGVWPNKIQPYQVSELSDFTKNEFKRFHIAKSHRNA